MLADILQAKGRFRDAGRYLNQAMQMAPYDGSAYYVKGVLEARQGDSLASLQSLDYAMNVNPRLLRAYLQSTIINRKLHNYDRAIIINDKAIKRFPEKLLHPISNLRTRETFIWYCRVIGNSMMFYILQLK